MWALCVLAVTRCKTWALYVLAVTRCKTCGHCVYWLLDVKRVGIVCIGCYEMLNVLALCVLAVTRCYKRVGIVCIGCYEMLNVWALCVLADTRC